VDDDRIEVLTGEAVESPLAKRRQAEADARQARSVGPVRNDAGVWVGTCPTCGAKVRIMSDDPEKPNAFWSQFVPPPKGLGVWCDALINEKSGERCEGQAIVTEANPKTMRVKLHKATFQKGGGMGEGSSIVTPDGPLIWTPN
jgi:hypothetical protein